MPKHGFKIALCAGLTGMALFAGRADAMTAQECGALPDNQFLAAVERGTCRIDIQTAAGPDTTITADSGGGDDGHNGRNNDGGGHRDGGGRSGGDGGDGGGNPGAGRAAKP
jgi:uncharacterized membrane protein YgcG